MAKKEPEQPLCMCGVRGCPNFSQHAKTIAPIALRRKLWGKK